MNATIHDFPRVTAALDEMAIGLETVLHSRFPELAQHTRVLVTLAEGGVEVTLRSHGLDDAATLDARRFLGAITGAVHAETEPAPSASPDGPGRAESGLRERRRPAQPRPLVLHPADGTGRVGPGASATVVRLAGHQRQAS